MSEHGLRLHWQDEQETQSFCAPPLAEMIDKGCWQQEMIFYPIYQQAGSLHVWAYMAHLGLPMQQVLKHFLETYAAQVADDHVILMPGQGWYEQQWHDGPLIHLGKQRILSFLPPGLAIDLTVSKAQWREWQNKDVSWLADPCSQWSNFLSDDTTLVSWREGALISMQKAVAYEWQAYDLAGDDLCFCVPKFDLAAALLLFLIRRQLNEPQRNQLSVIYASADGSMMPTAMRRLLQNLGLGFVDDQHDGVPTNSFFLKDSYHYLRQQASLTYQLVDVVQKQSGLFPRSFVADHQNAL